jgi:hypothetical protein
MTYAWLAIAVSVPLRQSRAACTIRSLYSSGMPRISHMHRHRQVLGELADQVGVALLAELVDEVLGRTVDVAADAPVVDGRHGAGDRAAQPQVLVALGVRADGLPGEVRHQRVVGLDRAVPHGVHSRLSLQNCEGRAHHVQVLGVAEHHPDRHVLVQQHGGHGAVFGAEFLVHGSQVLRLGTVQPAQPAGARAVRGAAGGRAEPGVVRVGRGVGSGVTVIAPRTEVDPVSGELGGSGE